MRTTVTFDDDTGAIVEQLRRERGIGVSAAVNELVRRAAARPARRRPPFRQRTSLGHALVDVNVLLYSEDASSPHHDPCRTWLETALDGDVRVGLPWPSLLGFVRIRTHPRAYAEPLSVSDAWDRVEDWLAAETAWIPHPTERHAAVLGTLLRRHHLTAGNVPDAHLAALAIEHGVGVCSADTDFARFTELRWSNPLA